MGKALLLLFIMCLHYETPAQLQNKESGKKYSSFSVHDSLESERLGPYIYYLEDKNGRSSIWDILENDKNLEWTKSSTDIPGFGYSQSSWWFRVSLTFEESEEFKENLLAEVGAALLDTLKCYFTVNGQIEDHYSFGDHFPFHDRYLDHRNFIFPIKARPDTLTIYFNIKSASSVSLPLTLWNNKSFIESEQKQIILMGLYFGILLILIFYNLYIFFSTRDITYLYYILCVISILGLMLALNGVGYQFLWPEYPLTQKIVSPIFVTLTSLSILQFSRKFLSLNERNIILNNIAKWTVAGWGLLVILSPFLTSSRFFAMIVGLSTLNILFTFLIGGVSFYKGYQPARFFVGGWLFFLFWLMLYASANLGIVPMTFFISNGFFVGVTVGLALISIAMADKIRILAGRREKMQQKVMRLMEIDREKNQMISVVAHDLKSPLNQIKGFISLINSSKDKTLKEREEYLGLIVNSVDRLKDMVTDILDVNSLDAQKLKMDLKNYDLAEITDETLQGFYPLAKNKKQPIITEFNKGRYFAKVDKTYLMQALENLLSNASKFSPPGSPIKVKIKEKNGQVRISVKDQGPGISESDQKRLFLPFEKLSAKPTGDESSSGLGMAIVKKYVDAMEGTIICKSKDQNGSTFIVGFDSLSELELNDQSID